jgi:hypothetical protein
MFVLLFLLISPSAAEESSVLFREDFSSLDNWKPFTFPKIEKHSTYTVERDRGRRYLKAESDASASAIVFKDSFNVYEYPRARWRWKVDNIYKKADPAAKAGDDYPIRVYIMFEYDPGKAGAFDKLKYGLARKLYGVYPPHSSLNYVWASRETAATIVTSPYTEQAKMLVLEQGEKHVGAWRDVEVNILDDYQRAFGVRPPARARLAIMNDSDNTGESAVSYMEYIEVSK